MPTARRCSCRSGPAWRRKGPLVAPLMTILLLSMAGIPLTAGFIGKFYVFRAAYHDAAPLVVIALLTSAVAAFFYLRIVVLMFFAEPPENGPTVDDSVAVDHDRAHARGGRHRVARSLPAADPRPGQQRGTLADGVTGVSPAPIGVVFADAELERSVRSGLDEVETGLRVAVRLRERDPRHIGAPSRRRRREAVPSAGYAPGRPLRRPDAPGDHYGRGRGRADPSGDAVPRRRHGRGARCDAAPPRPTLDGVTPSRS